MCSSAGWGALRAWHLIAGETFTSRARSEASEAWRVSLPTARLNLFWAETISPASPSTQAGGRMSRRITPSTVWIGTSKAFLFPSDIQMDAEIIAVGSELLTPYRLDTNSLFLTAELNHAGIRVTHKSIVGDNPDEMRSSFRD